MWKLSKMHVAVERRVGPGLNNKVLGKNRKGTCIVCNRSRSLSRCAFGDYSWTGLGWEELWRNLEGYILFQELLS